jgi:hypothetical protein
MKSRIYPLWIVSALAAIGSRRASQCRPWYKVKRGIRQFEQMSDFELGPLLEPVTNTALAHNGLLRLKVVTKRPQPPSKLAAVHPGVDGFLPETLLN